MADLHVLFFFHFIYTEMCLLSNNIRDYYFVSQGKTTIPGLDDGEELIVTDVSACCFFLLVGSKNKILRQKKKYKHYREFH